MWAWASVWPGGAGSKWRGRGSGRVVGGVGHAWMSWKALKGDMAPPMSRRVLTRASRMKMVLVASTYSE